MDVCPECGTTIGSAPALDSAPPTQPLPVQGERWDEAPQHKSLSVPSSDPLGNARFAPGTIIADRYRIVSLLGRGGMGEVFRAEDLVLGQTVALKFLPTSLAKDRNRLERLLEEVRVSRQVSHPNVCRVHDIDEADGQRFLSMEYVDGRDLKLLLRQIGHFSGRRAVEIARQICAGLAAAHDRGVLHRDLKPANILIDGHGRVQITDFGLAILAGDAANERAVVGTPAYMAPEQLTTGTVSVRSDVYALGMVLFELFTGRRAFESDGPGESWELRGERPTPRPSEFAPDIDPVVERVILRCLEAHPRDRPASAFAVAAALPGGDPLAAAIAAGETPAPSLVAAAGGEGALRPPVAAALVIAALLGGLLSLVFSSRWQLAGYLPLEKPPEVLVDRSRDILSRLGGPQTRVDSAFGLKLDHDYLDYLDADPSPTRWQALRSGSPAALVFWYRQSPTYMVAQGEWARITPDDPPHVAPGMATVSLDLSGQLIGFDAVPPRRDDEDESGVPDWSLVFAEAGLQRDSFSEVTPVWNPPVSHDLRAAWEGELPGAPAVPIRIEAASYRGRLVFFRLLGPWSQPEPPQPFIATVFFILLSCAVLLALVLARNNLRLGRSDHRGATRVAAAHFLLQTIALIVFAHHVPVAEELPRVLFVNTGNNLFFAAALWLFYVALEPFARRVWPDTLISWNRLLAGRFSDPLIGRDILVGALTGTMMSLIDILARFTPAWLGWPPPQPKLVFLTTLLGLGWTVGELSQTLARILLGSMFLVFVLVLLRSLLHNKWLTAASFVLVVAALGGDRESYPILIGTFAAVGNAIWIVALLRYGLVAAMVAAFWMSTMDFPLTSAFTAWYGHGSLLITAVWCVTLAAGFRMAVAGRRLFPERLL
jgi:serine/threonine-protein kinase